MSGLRLDRVPFTEDGKDIEEIENVRNFPAGYLTFLSDVLDLLEDRLDNLSASDTKRIRQLRNLFNQVIGADLPDELPPIDEVRKGVRELNELYTRVLGGTVVDGFTRFSDGVQRSAVLASVVELLLRKLDGFDQFTQEMEEQMEDVLSELNSRSESGFSTGSLQPVFGEDRTAVLADLDRFQTLVESVIEDLTDSDFVPFDGLRFARRVFDNFESVGALERQLFLEEEVQPTPEIIEEVFHLLFRGENEDAQEILGRRVPGRIQEMQVPDGGFPSDTGQAGILQDRIVEFLRDQFSGFVIRPDSEINPFRIRPAVQVVSKEEEVEEVEGQVDNILRGSAFISVEGMEDRIEVSTDQLPSGVGQSDTVMVTFRGDILESVSVSDRRDQEEEEETETDESMFLRTRIFGSVSRGSIQSSGV